MSETINREDLYLFQTGKARQAYLTLKNIVSWISKISVFQILNF